VIDASELFFSKESTVDSDMIDSETSTQFDIAKADRHGDRSEIFDTTYCCILLI
jgi:hypothetical protein